MESPNTEPTEEPIVISATEASAGSKASPTRWVMIGSIVLVIAAFAAVFIYYGQP